MPHFRTWSTYHVDARYVPVVSENPEVRIGGNEIVLEYLLRHDRGRRVGRGGEQRVEEGGGAGQHGAGQQGAGMTGSGYRTGAGNSPAPSTSL